MNEKELLIKCLKEEWKEIMGTYEGFDEKIVNEVLEEHPSVRILKTFAKLAVAEHKREMEDYNKKIISEIRASYPSIIGEWSNDCDLSDLFETLIDVLKTRLGEEKKEVR